MKALVFYFMMENNTKIFSSRAEPSENISELSQVDKNYWLWGGLENDSFLTGRAKPLWIKLFQQSRVKTYFYESIVRVELSWKPTEKWLSRSELIF